jgi:hypothetical protein
MKGDRKGLDVSKWIRGESDLIILAQFSARCLARIIHEVSSRNRGDAKRDGRVEVRGREASLKQDVDRPSDEPARLHAVNPRAGASPPRLRGRAPFT